MEFKYSKMNKLITFIIYISISHSCLGQSKEQSTISIDDKMISLMNEAKKLMKYTGDIELPKIYPTTVENLRSIVCKGIKYCPVKAVYHNDIIYYNQDLNLNDPITKSTFVHEFIHHIQANTGFRAHDCNIWYNNEKEAYMLQALYLKNNNQDTDFLKDVLKTIKCPP
jgi:hypothetical protein